MRWIKQVIIVLFMTTAVGCAFNPLSLLTLHKEARTTGDSVFHEAERKFSEGRYSEALVDYNALLRQHYDRPLAAFALYKIGKIYRLTGRHGDAVAVFSRLTREFPNSPRSPEAFLELLTILYEQGHPEAVVSKGVAYTQTAKANVLTHALFTLIANSYAALGNDLEAALFYYRAWNAAAGKQDPVTWGTFKESVEKLDSDEIQQLITYVADRPVMGFLLYRLGTAYIMEEEFDDAAMVLNAFVEQFPDDMAHQDALDLIQSLGQRARYAPYTVGCLLPLSGAYAVFGKQALEGIQLAVSQQSQMEDERVPKLIVKDTHSDARMAVKAVDELDQEKVAAILGPMATAESAARTAQMKGIPIVALTQREGIADVGDYVFRNFITPQMQVHALVQFALKRLGTKRFAVFYPNEKYGKRYMDLFGDEVARSGGMINGVEAYDPNRTDFSQPIKKLAKIYFNRSRHLNRNNGAGRQNIDQKEHFETTWGFEALFIPDTPKKAAMIIPQLAVYDIRNVYLLGTNLWHSQELIETSGDYINNALIVDGFSLEHPSQHVADFVATFQHVFNRTPGIIEAMAYDSAMMVFKAMGQTLTDSRCELRQALLKIQDFNGVTGWTGFAPNGEAEKNLQLLRIEGGQFVNLVSSLANGKTATAAILNP
ncbi:conserved hypothetical protein [Desulfosarcina cetonica]|uniref:penicillin-binding protein activator n=1 Tax=Desulfosarcina cetonica TaxID=90730 RepID=UPI0012ED84D3|nr:penicillin-binding protein activator [Desulfosarcina cetonica]VTR65372.1 conserved hypothetical protein [Desulfosarcina cetonica]